MLSSCPIAGVYDGVLPDNHRFCATMASDCASPDIMRFTVTDCLWGQHEFEGKNPVDDDDDDDSQLRHQREKRNAIPQYYDPDQVQTTRQAWVLSRPTEETKIKTTTTTTTTTKFSSNNAVYDPFGFATPPKQRMTRSSSGTTSTRPTTISRTQSRATRNNSFGPDFPKTSPDEEVQQETSDSVQTQTTTSSTTSSSLPLTTLTRPLSAAGGAITYATRREFIINFDAHTSRKTTIKSPVTSSLETTTTTTMTNTKVTTTTKGANLIKFGTISTPTSRSTSTTAAAAAATKLAEKTKSFLILTAEDLPTKDSLGYGGEG